MSELKREAGRIFRNILEGLLEGRVNSTARKSSSACDVIVEAAFGRTTIRFGVLARSRITPQTAFSIGQQLSGLPEGMIPVVYAPVVSPRVAEILRQQGIGYVDRAGNCFLRSLPHRLLVERQGFTTVRQPTPAAADPYSPKSSRIVRAMLSRPMEGWQVRQLAGDADVQVSVGLVVKVKRALIEEGYAVEHERRLYLRDPAGLLNAWAAKYSGPLEQVPLYFRGETSLAEQAVSRWCRASGLRHALAGFSAAWRLAPDVRYSVAAVFVEDRGFDGPLLDRLAREYGGKHVDTGPNLILWRPYDHSVFADCRELDAGEPPVTSALQTYLDLKRTAGRGEEATNAIFERYLSQEFQAAAKREEERQQGAV